MLAYLHKNPEFLLDKSELLAKLKAPKSNFGDGVVDMQHYMVGGLQKELRTMREQMDDMVGFCRDNLSTQAQVHQAALLIMRATDLEQLLQVLTSDLLGLFDLDVLRICMETDAAALYEESYPDASGSGLSFIQSGTIDSVLGYDADIMLVADSDQAELHELESIFQGFYPLARSCVLLRLQLDRVQKDVLLALGVRNAGRFSEEQGVELLSFLAEVIEWKLDVALSEAGVEEI